MPFIDTKTTVKVTDEKREELKTLLGKAIELIPGKTEKWLMLSFEDGVKMYFAGDNSSDMAYIEVKIFGTAEDKYYEALTKEITEIFGKVLLIAPDKIYVKYSEIENFGYNDEYTKQMFDWTNNLIFSLTNMNPKFCYSEYNNYDILDLCMKNKMYTVKPFVVNSSPFTTIKNNLSSGMIYSLSPTEEVLKELPTIVTYIKQKGYDLVKLEEIISENRTLEK